MLNLNESNVSYPLITQTVYEVTLRVLMGVTYS